VCDTLSSTGTPLTVRIDTRRYGKAVTVIEGFDDESTAKALGKELKHALATGGTAKDRHVELQGDQVSRVRRWLEERGYAVY
jgi:translation initiation factor 1